MTNSKPPGEGTRTRKVLEAFEPGEVVTAVDVSYRVEEPIVFDGDPGSAHTYLGSLVDRGFVERLDDESEDGYVQFRLTPAGEDVVSPP